MENFRGSRLLLVSVSIVALFATMALKNPVLATSSFIHGSAINLDEGKTYSGEWVDPLDRYVWDEFVSLVHPADASTQPEWEKWSTKCDAGLVGACSNTAFTKIAGRPADQAAAEIPRQTIIEFLAAPNNAQGEVVAQYAHAPELASVLFNPIAANSIWQGNLGRKSTLNLAIEQLDNGGVNGGARRLPPDSFAQGSEAVKLMWEIIPANGHFPMRLYDPNNAAVVSGGLQLFNTRYWRAAYYLDATKPCNSPFPPYGTTENKVTVPLSCFYYFRFSGGASCNGLSSEIATVYCDGDLEHEAFYAVLVGFHVMKLIPTNPNWVWMTFYWTRDVNDSESRHSSAWVNPWSHFHEASTTDIRELAPLDHQLCLSPYLEGPKKNGLKTNCLSCHSFAAYSPDESKFSAGSKLGESYPYPLAQRRRDEQHYFRGAIQTAFVWSVSTSQDSAVPKAVESFNQQFKQQLLLNLQ